MAMIVHDLIQGSPAWKAHRATRRNASDAAAMLGESPYMKRSELMRMIASGVVPETSEYQQSIYDSGHRFEAYARPIAEEIMGCELYPVSGSLENSLMSASLDGIDEDETEAFEHKSLNAILREIMQGDFTGADLPIYYRIQMEQQIAVSGVKRVLFMASEWREYDDAPPKLLDERHVWYYPDLELRARIIGGWAVFEEELAVYEAPPVRDLIIATAEVVLPAINVEVKGSLALISNLDVFAERFAAYLEKIPKKPTTDQEFYDCDRYVKRLGEIEKDLERFSADTIGKIASVDVAVKTFDSLREQARTVRLATEKLVKAQKLSVKSDIIAEGVKGFADHMKALQDRLGENLMPAGLAPDFGEAIKGKRTFDSSRDAMKVALADAKIAASATADRIQINLNLLKAQDAKHAHLFKQDRATIVLKATDDFASLVKARTAEFDIDEAQRVKDAAERIAAAARGQLATETVGRFLAIVGKSIRLTAAEIEAQIGELEREPINDEAFGDHVQRVRDARDNNVAQLRRLHTAAIESEQAAAAPAPAPAPAPAAEPARIYGGSAPLRFATDEGFVTAAVIAREPINEPSFAAPVASASKVRLGALCDMLGFTITADQMTKLGIEPSGKEGVAKLYAVADFARIRAALIARLESITLDDLEAIATVEKKRA